MAVQRRALHLEASLDYSTNGHSKVIVDDILPAQDIVCVIQQFTFTWKVNTCVLDSTTHESAPDSITESAQESNSELAENELPITQIPISRVHARRSRQFAAKMVRHTAQKQVEWNAEERTRTALPGGSLPVSEPLDCSRFAIPSLTATPPQSSTFSPDKMRQLMRSMPHSVVVITTNTPAPEKRHDWIPESNWKGMTLSSFTTLTLSPSPIVTFNIKRPSQTLDAIKQGKHFLVHILENNQRGAEIADTFSRGAYGTKDRMAHNPFENLRTSPVLENLSIGKVRSFISPSTKERLGYALPCIRDTGVRAVLYCSLLSSHSGGLIAVGDHTVCFAGVNQILSTGREKSNRRTGRLEKARRKGDTVDGFGLMYADGKFRQVGMRVNVDRAKHDRAKVVDQDADELSEILEQQVLEGGGTKEDEAEIEIAIKDKSVDHGGTG